MKVKNEVQAGRHETAASIALDQQNKRPIRLKIPFRLLIIGLILLLLTGLGLFTYAKLFTGGTHKAEAYSMVEKVQDLATLTTAEALVTTIIKEEDNKLFSKEISVNFPGTKRTILLIVPATVIAGVDLQSINDGDIVINNEKNKIALTLPHASILQEPSIQMDKVQTYSEEGLFRSDVKWDEGFDLAAVATAQIRTEAIDLGLLTKAEESAVKVLSEFFRSLGYEATIRFR